MNPLPDRTLILGILITLGLVFGLVFWFVRLAPSAEPALQWRDGNPPPAPYPACGAAPPTSTASCNSYNGC